VDELLERCDVLVMLDKRGGGLLGMVLYSNSEYRKDVKESCDVV
jgi:hypothetical protein